MVLTEKLKSLICHNLKNVLNRLRIMTFYQEIGIFVYCSSYFISIFHVSKKTLEWDDKPQTEQTDIHFFYKLYLCFR